MSTDNDIVIRVEGLSKKFCRSLRRSMLYGTVDVAKSMLGLDTQATTLRKGEFLALDNVSFELKRGEALGVIGHNGSGKTTLLRLLTGIFPPDAGSITIRGRVGALIAVGAGFHPHMSGRENIYLNGTILGMSRAELDAKFDEIVEFASIGGFIDAPVSTYSSGMAVRLGFAIAIHANTEILLADEVLAVGDLRFALRCQRKIAQFMERGGTVVLVSHNMQLVRNTCSQTVWLHEGGIRAEGTTAAVCDEYEKSSFNDEMAGAGADGKVIRNSDRLRISEARFLNEADEQVTEYACGERLRLRLKYECTERMERPIFTISMSDPTGNLIFEAYSDPDVTGPLAGNGTLLFETARLPIRPNLYDCTVSVAEGDVLNNIEWHEKAYRLKFANSNLLEINQGIISASPRWTVTSL